MQGNAIQMKQKVLQCRKAIFRVIMNIRIKIRGDGNGKRMLAKSPIVGGGGVGKETGQNAKIKHSKYKNVLRIKRTESLSMLRLVGD